MSNKERVDTASRIVSASPEKVYAAFADSNAWREWLPPIDMTCEIAEFDFREGGRYRLILTYTDGSGAGKTTELEDVSEGTFVDLVPHQRIVQRIVFESDDPVYAGTMLMTWELSPLEAGTQVTFAEDVPAGISPEDHADGMNSTLNNLARWVEERT